MVVNNEKRSYNKGCSLIISRVNIEDAESASDAFTLFMGDEVEPRRNYIETHAKDVKHLDV